MKHRPELVSPSGLRCIRKFFMKAAHGVGDGCTSQLIMRFKNSSPCLALHYIRPQSRNRQRFGLCSADWGSILN